MPFSLDIIDETALHQRGFFNPLDILETVPNVVRRQTQLLPSGGTYLIRGLNAPVLTNNRPENDSRGSGRRDSSQIERFEVLKGPVSILLGSGIWSGRITLAYEDNDLLARNRTARQGMDGPGMGVCSVVSGWSCLELGNNRGSSRSQRHGTSVIGLWS